MKRRSARISARKRKKQRAAAAAHQRAKSQLRDGLRSSEGFSVSELCKRLSELYCFENNKKFKAQVELALKRGVSYGLLVKTRNKYRYELTPPPKPTTTTGKVVKTAPCRLRRRQQQQPVKQEKVSKVSSTKTKQPSAPQTGEPNSKRKYIVPPPTVPPPPDWSPKPRYLPTEPYNKVIKPKS